jgi:uncharacterized protein (DUF1501 family)
MTTNNSRREFVKRASALSAAGVVAPWALNLAAIGAAAAQSAPSDYKALVCVFLLGGNDHGNTLVPYDIGTYNTYARLRGGVGGLGIDRALLAPTVLVPTDEERLKGRQYALAPALQALMPAFNAGRMGVLLNVGTLVQPTTKAQYEARSVLLPPKLFSHNDQQSFWQTSNPEGAGSGWGGRIGDLLASGTSNSTFTAVSVRGNAVFLSGNSVVQYQVSSEGSVPINGIVNTLYGSGAAAQALRSLITQAPSNNIFELEHARVVERSIRADVTLQAALGNATPLSTVFPDGSLAGQLRMVARMIAAREQLGVKRQVFFVGVGGFDLHDNLLAQHPVLLAGVGGAMAAFDKEMIALGVSNQVTAFTASDFGRTLTSNGDGSDHGWGSYHFVMGGAVQGKSFFGKAPTLGDNGPDDVGQGRMLPTMAVDQLAATLASWMGVSDTNLPTVVPSIGNYTTRNLGIFR